MRFVILGAGGLGSVIGGYLAKHYHPQIAFRLDAGTFLVSAALLLFMRPPQRHETAQVIDGKRDWVAELTTGFRYARGHRHIRELLAVAARDLFADRWSIARFPRSLGTFITATS